MRFLTCRALAASVAVAFAGGLAAAQQPKDSACRPALNALMDEWRSIGFTPPAKPAQAIVAGKGHVLTAGQFRYIEGQIRLARRECDSGAPSSIPRIAAIRDLLDRSAHGSE